MKNDELWLYKEIDTDINLLKKVLIKFFNQDFYCPFCIRTIPDIPAMKKYYFEDDEYSYECDDQYGQTVVCENCSFWASIIEHVEGGFTEYRDSEVIRIKESGSTRYTAVLGTIKKFNYNPEFEKDLKIIDNELSGYNVNNISGFSQVEQNIQAILENSGKTINSSAKLKDEKGFITVFYDESVYGAVLIKFGNKKISLDIIDTFAGALVNEGKPNGIFVTPSFNFRYSSPRSLFGKDEFQDSVLKNRQGINSIKKISQKIFRIPLAKYYKRTLPLEQRGFKIELAQDRNFFDNLVYSSITDVTKEQVLDGLRWSYMKFVPLP
jgi:hypothetical protein